MDSEVSEVVRFRLLQRPFSSLVMLLSTGVWGGGGGGGGGGGEQHKAYALLRLISDAVYWHYRDTFLS